jgi:hypothetical protein
MKFTTKNALTTPTELQNQATKSYLSEISQRLDEDEMSHIFVKKPRIEMENGYF